MLPASDKKLPQTLIGVRLKVGHDKVSTSSLQAVSGSATRTPLKTRRTNVAFDTNVQTERVANKGKQSVGLSLFLSYRNILINLGLNSWSSLPGSKGMSLERS